MQIDAFDITDHGLTFVVDGVPWSADSSHPNFDRIKAELISPTRDAITLIEWVDQRTLIQGKTFGLVTVGVDAIWYKAHQLGGYLIEKLMAMQAADIDITPWALLLDNLMRNPDERARERLPLFLEQAKMPITEDGHFLAWRLVKDDYWDAHTGDTFYCVPGAVIQMPRERCDPDPNQTCSSGIHVAAFGYLGSYGFGGNDRRCMLVKVNPQHVVAVPTDYSNQKLRCCEALILREVDKDKVPALFGRDDHVASEDGYRNDPDYPTSAWKQAVLKDETLLNYNEWVEHQRDAHESQHDILDEDREAWRDAVYRSETALGFDEWLATQ